MIHIVHEDNEKKRGMERKNFGKVYMRWEVWSGWVRDGLNELVRRCIDTWCGSLITERISKKRRKLNNKLHRNEARNRNVLRKLSGELYVCMYYGLSKRVELSSCVGTMEVVAAIFMDNHRSSVNRKQRIKHGTWKWNNRTWHAKRWTKKHKEKVKEEKKGWS